MMNETHTKEYLMKKAININKIIKEIEEKYEIANHKVKDIYTLFEMQVYENCLQIIKNNIKEKELMTVHEVKQKYFPNNFKKTSDKWYPKYVKKYGMQICDHDGWDRKNFNYSWYQEKITWEEFKKRALMSTQIPNIT